MKYKKGDKIKIKTWGKMEKEFGTRAMYNDGEIVIDSHRPFYKEIDKEIKDLRSNRVLIVSEVHISTTATPPVIEYGVVEFGYIISDEWIVFKKQKLDEPINNRFEILDL